jgi:hypothetical protein
MEAERPVAHSSSLGMKDAEHLSRQRLSRGAGMTAVLFASAFPAKKQFRSGPLDATFSRFGFGYWF